jgi:prepilin-type processing-associated H-X9-DG protein
MPMMRDPLLTSTTNDLPGPHQVLASQLGNTNVLRCPSDKWPADTPRLYPQAGPTCFDQTGSSYAWNSLLNGQNAEHLKAFGLNFDSHQIPLMFDRDKFHQARGDAKPVNYLYADGHIKNLLVLEGTLAPKP